MTRFQQLCSLISVTIPRSVTTVGKGTFYDCSVLTAINFNDTREQWNAITKGKYWDSNTGSYTVHCTDGDISK